MPKLANHQHEMFCRSYVGQWNASLAARRAGYSVKTARHQASDLLARPDISLRVNELTEKILAGTEEYEIASKQEVLAKLTQLMRSDRRNLVDEDGNAKPLHELDDDTAAAIDGVEIEEAAEGERKYKYKLSPRVAAADKLAQHHNAYEKHQQAAAPTLTVNIVGKDSDL